MATPVSKIQYRLYIGAAPQGAVGRVDLTGDIIDLRETIYGKRKGSLGDGLAAEDLELYAPRTEVPVVDGTKQLEDKDLADLVNNKEHVIVVVVQPPQPQQNGWNWRSIFGYLFSKQQNVRQWYQVSGTVERNKAAWGVRAKLFDLAKANYYPLGKNRDTAFHTTECPNKPDHRLLRLSVVFADMDKANAFMAGVDSFVTKTRGLSFLEDLNVISVAPLVKGEVILLSHYKARDEDAEPPDDSPVFDIELGSLGMHSATSYYNMNDPVYKYQRIEKESAFARGIPEGAHIFPRAKCRGPYSWLDKQDFNRLALSLDGHLNFDGSGRGRGKSARTNPRVSLEPKDEIQEATLMDGTFKKIEVTLWCKNEDVAKAWVPYLEEGAQQHAGGVGRPCFDHLYIHCRSDRRHKLEFEKQQNPDGGTDTVCLTCIPGVGDVTKMKTWVAHKEDVAVHEIMWHLIKASHEETQDVWKYERA